MDEPLHQGLDLGISLLKLDTREETTNYLRNLAEHYQKEIEKYGNSLGSLFRAGPQAATKAERKDDAKVERKEEPKAKSQSRGWVKLGPLLVNASDPVGANAEIAYQIHEELKQRLAKTAAALKAFEEGASALASGGATYSLLVRNGVPERIVVEVQEKKREPFSFSAMFNLV